MRLFLIESSVPGNHFSMACLGPARNACNGSATGAHAEEV